MPRVRDDARTIACGTLAVLCRTSRHSSARPRRRWRRPPSQNHSRTVSYSSSESPPIVLTRGGGAGHPSPQKPLALRDVPVAAIVNSGVAARVDTVASRANWNSPMGGGAPTTNSRAPAKRTRFFPLPLAGAVRSADFMASRRAHACRRDSSQTQSARSDLRPACRGRLGTLRFAARCCVASHRRECYTCDGKITQSMTLACTSLLLSADASAQGRLALTALR